MNTILNISANGEFPIAGGFVQPLQEAFGLASGMVIFGLMGACIILWREWKLERGRVEEAHAARHKAAEDYKAEMKSMASTLDDFRRAWEASR